MNRDIHTYLAYSADPDTSKEFAAFKADDSKALKLLYCINMLNEGVHVKGISGVILFRPTVSPIIYKQQNGRALTAGDSAMPLIIDVVNNFDGLCSIDSIQEVMELVVQQYRLEGRGNEIVTDRFEVIEQVQDCRELFERLERGLVGGWEQYFQAASIYAAEHGDLLVPAGYKSPDGHALGAWINKLRRSRRAGELPEEQIERLDAIGMFWGNRHAESWETNYRAAEKYYRAHGDLDLTSGYVTKHGLALGKWVVELRLQRKKGVSSLTPERIARLDAIGMIWDKTTSWEYRYELCRKYLAEHNCTDIPRDYKTDDGIWLGTWLYRQRRIMEGYSSQQKLSERQRQLLRQQLDVWGPDARVDRRTKRYRRADTVNRAGPA